MRAIFVSAGRMRLLSLVVAAIVATGGFIAAFGLPGAGAQTTSYTGCVNYYTGQFRVLLYGTTCSTSEMPINFGETGPAGPPGPPGPAGTLQAALDVGYEGSDLVIPIAGQTVPFDTTYTTVGVNIVHSTPETFTVAETGVYRVEFILQGTLENSGGARIRVNGVPVGPTFTLPNPGVIILGYEQQLMGTMLLDLTAGDVVDIYAAGDANPANTVTAGSTLIITQLSSAPAP